MNSKKAKRNKEESLLISYNSAEDRRAVDRSSESEDNVPPLDLPPTRLRRPRTRKLHVAPQSRTGCSLWNALQVIFVLFTVGTMISMMWFTIILKTSLESMKKRVTSLESFDRSTSREYESLSIDLTQKYDTLKASKEKAMKHDDDQYKSILKQIAHLNSTVNDLQKRVKLPGSASTITRDVESLKKGMADTGGDITEIKDKIKQLTKLASQENGKVDELSKNVFNLSVQVAHVMGKPTPKAPKNTGTPPLILRIPVSNDEQEKAEDKSIMKNITAQISVEVARVMGIVTSVNHTLSHDIVRLRVLMKSLLTEVKKHVALIDELQTKVSESISPNESIGHLEANTKGVSEKVFNLSLTVTKLSDDVEQHSNHMAELLLEVVQINKTVHNYQHQEAIPEKQASCNCSGEVRKLWEQLSNKKLITESVQQVQTTQKPVTILTKKNTSAVNSTEASISNVKESVQNQSLTKADSVAAETDKDMEQDELEAENVKPSPSPGSNSNDSLLTVDKVTEPSVTASPSSGHANSTHFTQGSNTTASPQVTIINSTENNQTLPTQKVQVIKLATPSAEEEFEHDLEAPGTES